MNPNKLEQKYPSKEELDKILTKYQELDLKGVSYPKLFIQLQKDLRLIPFTTAKLRKGSTIERARINKQNEIFYSENEISYRTDPQNITKFGRANTPHTSMFYGSIISEKIKNPRIVNLIETEETFRLKKENNLDIIYTVGKWRLMEELEVGEIVFSKKVREQNRNVEEAFIFHVEKIKQENPYDYEFYIRVLEFFADEFSKHEINSDDDYKFSTAYMEMALEKGLPGIIYPSVRTEYMGSNIVLPVRAVEQFLNLEIVAMFKVRKVGQDTLIHNAKIATELGPMNSKFNWEDLPKLSDQQVNQILLDK